MNKERKTAVVANTQVGDRLRMSFATTASDYSNADMAVTGIGWIIHDGVANKSNWANYDSSFVTSRHPRTALGWNDTHLFMMVVDGRQTGYSIGMTFQEMADFLTGTLGALDVVNLDGGGSSVMLIRSSGGAQRIVNRPSGGGPRPIPVLLGVQERSR